MAAWGLWPSFWLGRAGGYALQLYTASDLAVCLSTAIGWALWLLLTISLGPQPGRTVSWALWPIRYSGLALHICRATGCDLCLSIAANKNMVHQDLWAHFCKFHPLLHLYLIPNSPVSPVPPVILVGQDPSGPPRVLPALLGKLDVCLGLSFS